jgi:hypothetical protein
MGKRADQKRLLEEQRQQHNDWLRSRLRKGLVACFFAGVILYVGVLIFYSLPLPVTGDTTMCSTTTTHSFASNKRIPVSTEVETECSRRGLPTWLLVAAPIGIAAPLLAAVVYRPGRVRASLKIPGIEETFEVESVDGLSAIIDTSAESTKRAADEYQGAD